MEVCDALEGRRIVGRLGLLAGPAASKDGRAEARGAAEAAGRGSAARPPAAYTREGEETDRRLLAGVRTYAACWPSPRPDNAAALPAGVGSGYVFMPSSGLRRAGTRRPWPLRYSDLSCSA